MFKNKILPLLLAILCAFVLWSYVITYVSADREETFYDIPVSFQGEGILEDRGFMVVSEKPTVTLTLYGNRAELNKLDSSKITIYADLSKVASPGVHSLSYNSYYGDIPTNAFTVQSQYPGLVKVTVEKRVTKDVPVVIKTKGTVQEDFIADRENVELDYENITITGPASSVDPITQAVVEVDLQDKSDSFVQSYRFTLCDSAGRPVDAKMVEVNVAEVNVTMYIKAVKEVPLTCTILDGGGATARTSVVKINPGVIQIAGNENVLKSIKEINLGTIDLGVILNDSDIRFEIKLPEGVTNLSGMTEAVVSVSFPDLMTKTFTITRFTEMNVPEGMDVEFITKELTVTIRGPKEIMNKMGSTHLSVRVDFAGAELGTDSFKAMIIISTGFDRAGAVGTYWISAKLVEEPPEETKTP